MIWLKFLSLFLKINVDFFSPIAKMLASLESDFLNNFSSVRIRFWSGCFEKKIKKTLDSKNGVARICASLETTACFAGLLETLYGAAL